MEVKIPGSALGGTSDGTVKKINIRDVPGHYHFKDKLHESMEEAKAIIMVVDSKEKYDLLFVLMNYHL
jgi:signal recognition particle receptor subunit beta